MAINDVKIWKGKRLPIPTSSSNHPGMEVTTRGWKSGEAH
jgi:hypothetical protein